MTGAASSVLVRHSPFGHPGTRASKGRPRCIYAASVVLTGPVTEATSSLQASDSQAKAAVHTGLHSSLHPGHIASSSAHTAEANNVVPAQTGVGQPLSKASEAQAQSPKRPRRGRPKGQPAWNKGKSISDTTRQRISQAQKERWKQKPDLHAILSSKNKGVEPWNKGQSMSLQTRLKMSAAKIGRPLPKAVRAKISQAHIGKVHSEAARAKMTASRTGMLQSPEHRAKIAATQRRRQAAKRVLTAVEAFHRCSDADVLQGAGKPGSLSPLRKKRRIIRCLSGYLPPGKPTTRTAIMTAYKSQLREYRALQEELGPWTQAFKAQHGCKPCLLDVERTGIDWLVGKFKAYMLLREKLLTDTSILRDKLDVAQPDLSNGASGSNGAPPVVKMSSYATKLNANAASAKRSRSAGSVSAALEYRRQQQALAETAAISSAAKAAAAASAQASMNSPESTPEASPASLRAVKDVVQQLHVNGTELQAGRLQHGAQSGGGDDDIPSSLPEASSNGVLHKLGANGHITHHSAPLSNSDGHTPENVNAAQSNGSGARQNYENGHMSNGARHPASEAASDSKASVLTTSEFGPAQQHQNGNAADASAAQNTSTATADDKMRLAIANMPSGRAANGSGKPLNGVQPGKQKHIPTPLPNTSPRIKSALLAAEEYRKKKAAKTAALALAAAHAAAAAGSSE